MCRYIYIHIYIYTYIHTNILTDKLCCWACFAVFAGWPYHFHGRWSGQKGRRVLCGQTGHHAHLDGELWQSSQAKEADSMRFPWRFHDFFLVPLPRNMTNCSKLRNLWCEWVLVSILWFRWPGLHLRSNRNVCGLLITFDVLGHIAKTVEMTSPTLCQNGLSMIG